MKIKEKVWFEIINNKQVFCILSKPENSQNKMVIMSHGFRGSNIGPARTFVDFGRILTENGFSVLRFDQPNSANSEGNYIDSSFREWVKTIAYFGNKYIDMGNEIILLGQSMGATATMIATNEPELKDKVEKLILWVPDPETDFIESHIDVGEEGGQLYRNLFWKEASTMDFFGCLDKYNGKIHLVYGEDDKYVSKELREQTLNEVTKKGGKIMVLEGQNHSSWEFEQTQKVFQEELTFIKT